MPLFIASSGALSATPVLVCHGVSNINLGITKLWIVFKIMSVTENFQGFFGKNKSSTGQNRGDLQIGRWRRRPGKSDWGIKKKKKSRERGITETN